MLKWLSPSPMDLPTAHSGYESRTFSQPYSEAPLRSQIQILNASMEPASLVLSAIGLAGLFSNAIDCFKYIQIAKEYEKDFMTGQLRLDLAGLQLSRWGKAIGLSDRLTGNDSLEGRLASAKEISVAEKTLRRILFLIKDAEEKYARYQSLQPMQDKETDEAHTSADLESATAGLHQVMVKTIEGRKNKSRLLRKSKWALYGKKDLDRLVDDIVELVEQLVELFPSAKPKHLELCQAEAAELAGEENVEVLVKIARAQDKALNQAFEKACAPSTGHSYSDFTLEDVQELQNGDVVDSGYYGSTRILSQHNYERFSITGVKVVTIGNTFRRMRGSA